MTDGNQMDQKELTDDNDSAKNVVGLPQELYSEQKEKHEEMKRLVEKYGQPDELWKDPTTKEIHDLYKSRTEKNEAEIPGLLR